MRARHVLDEGGKVAAAGPSHMGRHSPALVEDFDRRGGRARLDPFVHKLIGHAVEIVGDLNVIIDVDATWLPLRQLVPRRGQRLEGGPIKVLEERPSTHADRLHGPEVDRVDPLANGGIESGKGEEGPVAQRRQHPPLGDLDAHLSFRFVLGPRHSRWN